MLHLPLHSHSCFKPLALLTLLALSYCTTKDPEPQLPPETKTGANTFGCKIDGKIFVPRDKMGKPGLYAVQYVNLGAGKGGGYFLNLAAIDWQSSDLNSVAITTDSLLVQEGKTYQFKRAKGNAKAEYNDADEYYKLDQDPGELTITRLDPAQRILSGRFYFTGTDPGTGRKVQVTDGRFDVQF